MTSFHAPVMLAISKRADVFTLPIMQSAMMAMLAQLISAILRPDVSTQLWFVMISFPAPMISAILRPEDVFTRLIMQTATISMSARMMCAVRKPDVCLLLIILIVMME